MARLLVRTIQTCQIGFEPAIQRGYRILLMPLAQEDSDKPMDTGSGEQTIKESLGDLVDTSRLHLFPSWHTHTGDFSTDGAALVDRARKLRTVLRQREENAIAIVSHGNFAHYIVGNIDEYGDLDTRGWSNSEWRSYEFLSDNDEEAQLQEVDESKRRRADVEKRTAATSCPTAVPGKDRWASLEIDTE